MLAAHRNVRMQMPYRKLYTNQLQIKQHSMKHFYTLMSAGLMAVSAMATPPPSRVAMPSDPFNIATPSRVADPRNAEASTTKVFRPKHRIRSSANSEATTYSGAFQSFYTDEGKQWAPEGGDFLNYDVTVSISGTTATISNLFNLVDGYPFDGSEQFDITGTYDEQKGTITIPTPHQLDSATLAGIVYGAYPTALIAGSVSPTGALTPDSHMVLTLNADGTISTTQNFGAMMYDTSGSAQGFKCVYKGAIMSSDLSKSRLVTFTTDLDFGKCYVGDTNDKTFRVFNLGNSDVHGTIEATDQFSVKKNSIDFASSKATEIEGMFSPVSTGQKHGTITVHADGADIQIATTGSAVEMPDYSYLITKGTMTFYTGADFPFVPYMKDGHRYARSDLSGATPNSESYLRVTVNVGKDQLGTFSWQGVSTNEAAYAGTPSITVDGKVLGDYSELLNTDISGQVRLSEGKHEIEFNYQAISPSYLTESDFMWVGGLQFEQTPMAPSEAELTTETIAFPNSLISTGETADKIMDAGILNIGKETLDLISVTPSEHFSAETATGSASTLREILVPLHFHADKPGKYEENVVLETSAGNFTVKCSALVREMPDFQSIVAKGDFTFQTDEQNPFLVENGVAYNSTAKVPDTAVTTSRMTASFTVPEGYFGRLSWKGDLDCAGGESGVWTDFLSIGIQTPQKQAFVVVSGKYDLDTSKYPYIDEPDLTELMCTPGECSVTFSYIQYGDNAYTGEDRVQIHDLGLELIEDNNTAIMSESEIDFDTIFVGREAERSVSFLNMSSTPLEIYDTLCEGDFYGAPPSTTAPYNQYLNLPIYFMPSTSGHHEAEMIIKTSAGDFVLKVSGEAKSVDGIIMLEDFEDDAANWYIYDRDGDGDCWNLAFNVFGGYPKRHVHGGEECVVSFSGDYFNNEWRTFRPDNWTISPSFTVPEEGAWLTWYAAADFDERLGDIYSAYIGEGAFNEEDILNPEAYKEVAKEQLNDTEWHFHKVDLAAYAGKELHVAFRHHESEGKYMVKIDDVIVYDHEPAGVAGAPAENARAIRTLFHSPDGRLLGSPSEKGITIVTTVYDDGTVKSRKVLK